MDAVTEIDNCGGAGEDRNDGGDDAVLVYVWFWELTFAGSSSAVVAASVRVHSLRVGGEYGLRGMLAVSCMMMCERIAVPRSTP